MGKVSEGKEIDLSQVDEFYCYFIILFTYFLLCWALLAAWGFPLAVVSGGSSLAAVQRLPMAPYCRAQALGPACLRCCCSQSAG